MSLLDIKEREDRSACVMYCRDVSDAIRRARDGVTWKGRLSSRKEEGQWSGVSFTDSLELANFGWQEGAEKIHRSIASVRNTGVTRAKSHTNDYFGDRIDMARYCAGEHACFNRRVGESMGRSRLLRIVVKSCYHSGTDHDRIANRGAAIAALVEAAEFNGQSVELIAAFAAESSGCVVGAYVAVKQAGERLDMPRLAFWLMHASALRRLAFGLFENFASIEEHFNDGYGRPCDPHKHIVETANCISLAGVNDVQCATAQAARESLSKELSDMNCSIQFQP